MTLKPHTVLLHWGLGTILNFSGKSSEVQIREYFHRKKLLMVQKSHNNTCKNIQGSRLSGVLAWFSLTASKLTASYWTGPVRPRWHWPPGCGSVLWRACPWSRSCGPSQERCLPYHWWQHVMPCSCHGWAGPGAEAEEKLPSRLWKGKERAAVCRIVLWRRWGLRVQRQSPITNTNTTDHKLVKGR